MNPLKHIREEPTPMKNTAFMTWWRQVNESLGDEGSEELLFGLARSWFAEGVSVDEALERVRENLESSQEERSYYDV